MPLKQLISISDSFSEKYSLTVNPRVGQNDPPGGSSVKRVFVGFMFCSSLTCVFFSPIDAENKIYLTPFTFKTPLSVG